MKQPLLVALPGALIGFGGWIWLTGPGTSVPNALVALLCAVLCGRLAWRIAARNAPGDGTVGPSPAAGDAAPPRSVPASRRTPPPADAEPWRRAEGER